GDEVRQAPLAEALHRVREDVPARPGDRLAALPPDAPAAGAAERRAQPPRLRGPPPRGLGWGGVKGPGEDPDRPDSPAPGGAGGRTGAPSRCRPGRRAAATGSGSSSARTGWR